jgi:hypothetical protein
MAAERVLSRLHRTIYPGKKSTVERARFLPDGTRSVAGSGDWRFE